MAVTLASDTLSDAEVTDGIGTGDAGAAARLWVRYWPTALSAAREYVEPAEVPGLAAEALIGTIAAIAVGRGPREDVAAFVYGAVRELGEDDGPPPARTTSTHPDVFVSPLMSTVFADLPAETQEVLWFTVVDEHADDLIAEAFGVPVARAAELRYDALTVLQRDYVALHTAHAEAGACRTTHAALWAAAEGADRAGLTAATWVHLSSCAWCTEAFHEVAFSTIAISSLVDRSEVPLAAAAPAPAALVPEMETADLAVVEPAPIDPLLVADPAVAAGAAGVPDDEEPRRNRTAAPAWFRGRRGVVVALAAAAAVTAAIVTVGPGLGSGDDEKPAAAGTSASPEVSGFADPTPSGDPAATPVTSITPSPTATSSSPGSPSTSPTPTPSAAAGDEASPDTRPTPKPKPAKPAASSTPTPKPSPSAQPSATPPAATPTPTPTSTAKPCNGLQHLLGIC